MGLNIQVTNAAHQYGLDTLDVHGLFNAINADVLGEETSVDLSWKGSLLSGQSGEITISYSNGFTIKQTVQNIDGQTAKITLESVYRTETNELLIQTEGDKVFTFPNVGNTLQSNIIYAGDDQFNGNDFNNVLNGFGGNDLINGHAGIDAAHFLGFADDYAITVQNNGSIIIDGADGTDTLINIERLEFDDKKLAFDLSGNAGKAAKLIGAVFGVEGLSIQLNTGTFLSLLDNGLDYSDVMNLALTVKLGTEFSNADEVRLLYENLLNVEPSDNDIEFWVNTIESGEYTQTTLALMAADAKINQQNINLTSLARTGLSYADTNTTIPLSNQNNIDSLLANSKWSDDIGAGASVTYSFRSEASSYSTDDVMGYGSPDGVGEPWQADSSFLTTLEIEGIKASLNVWSEIANIRLIEVTDSETESGDIRFSTLPEITDAITYQPESSSRGGDIWLPVSSDLNTSTKGTYGYTTFLRETGHALGLAHPDEGRVIAEAEIDALSFSIMSKRDFINDSLDNKRDILYPTTPMLNDIAAIQYLYGANKNTRSDDTIYSWEPDQQIYETLWDGGGNDTIDWSNQITPVNINLNHGTWSDIGPSRWDGKTNINTNLAIAYDTLIENVNGGSSNDVLTGNSADNIINGGDGDDELHGGKGADIFDFEATLRGGNDVMYGGPGDDVYVIDSSSDMVVELTNEGVDIIWSGESYSLAELENIEKLYLFGSDPINATGNILANELRGNDNDNILNGAEGNDFLVSSAGNDTLSGGEGVDTAVYLSAKDDYIINISNPNWQIEDVTGDIDSLTSIERLKFVDINIAFDLDSNAGDVAKIIGAVFGTKTLKEKGLIGIGMNLIDNDMDYTTLMNLALDTKLGGGFTNADEVNLLYKNLVGISPSKLDLDFWVNEIVSGQYTQTSLAIFAADHDINLTNIDLVGLAETGLEYT